MNMVYNFLSAHMNKGIFIMGVILGLLIIFNYLKLIGHKSKVESALDLTNTKTVFNPKTQSFENESQKEQVTPDTVRELEKTFNAISSWHSVFSMLIPVFPLFGILGTVAGLILQLANAEGNIVFDNLNLALGSTFWGLIFAILLKIIDALFPTRTINETENLFEDYNKKLNNSIMLGNVKAENK